MFPTIQNILPKKGFTLQTWFPNSVDSNCIATEVIPNRQIDIIYSRRFEHSLKYGCNLVRPNLNTILDIYSYNKGKYHGRG